MLAPTIRQHHTVYAQPGRFAGWPANYGIWSWGNEIVTGFWVGQMDLTQPFHKRSRQHPMVAMQARSVDGGASWQVNPSSCPTPEGRAFSADEHVVPELQLRTVLDADRDLIACPGVALHAPNSALLCARTGLEPGALSWFYYSGDRCHTWLGPYALPSFGLPGTQARTDYVVLDDSSWLLFLTANKTDGREGRVFCARTDDAGSSFRFLSWIGPEPQGYAIMPASLSLGQSKLLCAIRRSEPAPDGMPAHCWIALWRSDDLGATWHLAHDTVAETGPGGNPPSLIALRDGQLCLTYGYRAAPFGIRARLSSDQGASWSGELLLRDDGADGDLGYVRSVQRADSAIVTVYYMNTLERGERTIDATIWRP